MLRAQNLSKKIGKRQILQDISLEVKRDSIVGLLGPNGAGKTTSFYLVVGLIASDSGIITVDDTDITRAAMHQRAHAGIGYLPQEPSIFRKLSVYDNILAVTEMRSDLNSQQKHQEVERLMEEFQVSHLSDQLGISLSGGERRRVEIARALALNPKYILLDEPFAGVDPISVKEIQKIICQLKDRNIGILITDHNVRETLGICDQAYILNAGQMLASGTSDQILANEEVRKVYLGDDFML